MMTFIQILVLAIITIVAAMGATMGPVEVTPASWECPDPIQVRARLESQAKLPEIAKVEIVVVPAHGVGALGAPKPLNFASGKAISGARPRPNAQFYVDFHVDDISPMEMDSFLVEDCDDDGSMAIEAGVILGLSCVDLFSWSAVLTLPIVLGLMFA